MQKPFPYLKALKKISFVFLFGTLSACVTSFSVMDETLPKLVGQNSSEAVKYLGFPSEERSIMGRKVYVWSNRVWMPDSATTTNMTGKVGGKPFTATSTTYGGNGGHDVICELRLIVHRLLRARARIDANMVDEDDFDEDREGWTAEQVWDAMRGSLPLVPDLVASHGDFSLDNVLICDGEVAGCIDAGRVGIADRYQDLAVAWNCLGEFGASLQERFLAQYGIHDLGRRKLQFHLMLDELF